MRRVRHERGGFNATPPVFDVFGVVSTPPHLFLTAFDTTGWFQHHSTYFRHDGGGFNTTPLIFDSFQCDQGARGGYPPHAGSGNQRYAHQFFSFLFCLIPPPPNCSTQTRREGLNPSRHVSAIHTVHNERGCTPCFFHSHRRDGREVSPSLLVMFLLSTKTRRQGGVPPCHHVYINACNEDLLVKL